MPLYDIVFMVKKGVDKRSVVELLSRLGQRVYATRGVITDVKSFGHVNLAYPIKKRDGRHHKAQMMQMTMMVKTSFGEQLSYLNQDERLLRWLVVKSRGDEWLRGPSSS
ncbi:hypothetical protein Mapa_011128 [Marchantia paleacea]|nr:hypothetical protein Mapa_011128 [Marchantia paleacea]